MRRQALQGGNTFTPLDTVEPTYYGPWGALNPSGALSTG